MRQVCLDTETTGLEPGRESIIEIACVEIIDRKVGRTYHTYVKPRCRVSEGAAAIHGIRDEFLKDKPTFKEIYNDFAEFIRGAHDLIAHNAPFDMRFLDEEIARVAGGERIQIHVIDTLAMARKRWPGKRNTLDHVAQRLEVPDRRNGLHGALVDTQMLAEIYLALTAGQKVMTYDAPPVPEGRGIIAYRPNGLTLSKVSPEEQKAHEDYCKMLKREVW
jgi:DNA polymerase-3 subunit epsilon